MELLGEKFQAYKIMTNNLNKKKNEQKLKEAQEIVVERQERINRCQQKIQKALEEENCVLTAQAIINTTGTNFNIMIMAKED